jgi:SAM-dependent methyltransferase
MSVRRHGCAAGKILPHSVRVNCLVKGVRDIICLDVLRSAPVGSRYESLVFDVIPAGCERALDVGCGNGELTRELCRRGIPEIVGLDRDEPCVQRCRNHPEGGDVQYVVGDLSTADLARKGFDLVSAVASLHHMDAPPPLHPDCMVERLHPQRRGLRPRGGTRYSAIGLRLPARIPHRLQPVHLG